ncbi:MAG TPA: response regulator transcription factor [Myxococcota bacterium]|nr:response regulator transcription factor [Myxococcota bacterium]
MKGVDGADASPVVLIVEDDPSLRRGLEISLQAEGYRTLLAPHGELALALLEREPVDLMLLDIMLPGRSGLEVCRDVRARGFELPIVIVSARGTEQDVIRGLGEGADDYVTKPFRPGELIARVRARLRRPAPTAVLRFGDVAVDLGGHEVLRGGHEVELSPTEFALLRLFLRRPGSVLTRDTILDAVWGRDYEGTDRTVDNFVTRLRQKLDAPGEPRYFKTVRGVGYRFEPDEPT